MARKRKVIGSGPSQEVVEEWEVDAAVLKELRELEHETAGELGDSGGGHAGPQIVVVQVPPTAVEPVTIEVLGRRPTAADQIAPPKTVDALPEPVDETPEKPPEDESYF
jgi:hypothetical protein